MSILKVNKIESTNTTAGGIEIDSTGHCKLDGLQMPTKGPFSNRNLIINGAMEINQRGTSASDQGYHTVDRYANYHGGSLTTAMSKVAITSGDPYDEGFRNILRLQNSAASTSTTAYVQWNYSVEAQDLAKCGWNYKSSSSYITVSFWARSSVAGTYYTQYRAMDTGSYYINKSFTLAANTWKKVSHQIPGSSSLVINNDNGAGLKVVMVPHYGSGYTGSNATDGSWFTLSGNHWFPTGSYTQNWGHTSGNTFDVTGLQLEVGEMATPFEHRSYADELARCQRYYEIVRGGGGMYWGSGNRCGMATYKVEKRDTPSTVTASTVYYEYPSSSTWQGVDITKHGFGTQRSGSATTYLIIDANWNVNAEL